MSVNRERQPTGLEVLGLLTAILMCVALAALGYVYFWCQLMYGWGLKPKDWYCIVMYASLQFMCGVAASLLGKLLK